MLYLGQGLQAEVLSWRVIRPISTQEDILRQEQVLTPESVSTQAKEKRIDLGT